MQYFQRNGTYYLTLILKSKIRVFQNLGLSEQRALQSSNWFMQLRAGSPPSPSPHAGEELILLFLFIPHILNRFPERPSGYILIPLARQLVC